MPNDGAIIFGDRRVKAKRSTEPQMKVKCPECPAETDLGPDCNDLTDLRYRFDCPVLLEHRLQKGADAGIGCSYMHRAIVAAILKFRRDQ
jgi:hypothetical protein